MNDHRSPSDVPARFGLHVLPTVFVGLGGTGAAVLMQLRRRFAETWGVPSLPVVGQIVLDTAPCLSSGGADGCSALVPGGDLGFSGTEFRLLTFEDPSAAEAVAGPVHPELLRLAAQLVPGSGSGQQRALGRLSFLCGVRNSAAGTGLIDRLVEIVQRVRSEAARTETARITADDVGVREDAICIHVVAGLGGGTGSGMVIEAGLLAKSLPRLMGCPDLPVVTAADLVLPSVHEAGIRDTPSHQVRTARANAFATLKELERSTLRDPESFAEPAEVREYRPGERCEVRGGPFRQVRLIGAANEAGCRDLDPAAAAAMLADRLFLGFLPTGVGFKAEDRRITLASFAAHDLTYRDWHDASGKCTFRQDAPRAYTSFGLARIFVGRGRIMGGATLLACAAAAEALVRPDTVEPVTESMAAEGMRPFTGPALAARVLRVPVAGHPGGAIPHTERIQRELAALGAALAEDGAASVDPAATIEAKCSEIIDDYLRGPSHRSVEEVTVPDTKSAAVRAAIRTVSGRIDTEDPARGCIEAALHACRAILRVMQEDCRRCSLLVPPDPKPFRRAMDHLRAAARLPLRRRFAVRAVLAHAVPEAVRHVVSSVEAGVLLRFGPGVAGAVADAIGEPADAPGPGGEALVHRLRSLRESLRLSAADFRSRAAVVLPDSAPATHPGAVELPYRGLPWAEVRAAVTAELDRRSVRWCMRSAGAQTLRRIFDAVMDRAPHRTLAEGLADARDSIPEMLRSRAAALVRELEMGDDADAADALLTAIPDPPSRHALIEAALRHSAPWWPAADVPPAYSGRFFFCGIENRTIESDIAEVRSAHPDEPFGTRRSAGSKEVARHRADEILFIVEAGGHSLSEAEETARCRQAYESLLSESPVRAAARLHSDPDMRWSAPEIALLGEDEAGALARSLERVLLGIALGLVRPEDGRLRIDVSPEPAHTGRDLMSAVRIVAADEVLGTRIDRRIDDWLSGAAPRELAEVGAVVGHAYCAAFPEPRPAGPSPAHAASYRNLVRKGQTLDARASRGSGESDAHRLREEAYAALDANRIPTRVVLEWPGPKGPRRLLGLAREIPGRGTASVTAS